MRPRLVFPGLALLSLSLKAPAAEKVLAQAPDLVVFSKIAKRSEIWDRRSNPLMGRPDFLKEILWTLDLVKVESGSALPDGSSLQVSLKERALLSYLNVREGSSGHFSLRGVSSPYQLVEFRITEAGPIPTVQPRPTSTPLPPPPFPEGLWARDLKKDLDLRRRVRRWARKNLGFENPEIIYLSSFSGPMPPQGGYLYWGIKGKVRGRGMVWQPGYGKKAREGDDLMDPHENQK